MHIIQVNIEKNRIYMKLSGYLNDEEVKVAAEKFKTEVQRLKPPVDIINDISEFRPATAAGAEVIKEAQMFVAQYGVRHLVRVVKDKVSGLLQFSTTGKQAGLQGQLAESLAEAEKILDEMK